MLKVKKELLEKGIVAAFKAHKEWVDEGKNNSYYPILEILEDDYNIYMWANGGMRYPIRDREGIVIETIHLDDVNRSSVNSNIRYYESVLELDSISTEK
ncbi:hypothetical protein [Psychroflexus montanilacus]|uniref:hypothetical protein n=1 Tax=Psychroflexus montanilacus TaxID=2873598 RepID=UPI001CCB6160|nr:hypothetical protein [Psychroflexus montanilacus]MBZ9652648.1 hypothetical protein [Psychroflexus montanilacus]